MFFEKFKEVYEISSCINVTTPKFELEARIEAIEAKQAERFPMILSKFKHLDSAWVNIKILYLVVTILVIVFVTVFFFLHIQKLD